MLSQKIVLCDLKEEEGGSIINVFVIWCCDGGKADYCYLGQIYLFSWLIRQLSSDSIRGSNAKTWDLKECPLSPILATKYICQNIIFNILIDYIQQV